MRKHVLIFVHGMGSYVTANGDADNSWSIDAAAALKEQYDQYAFVSRKPFDQRFELCHINYDTEIFKLVKRWQDESRSIMGTGVTAAAPVDKILKWLNNSAQLDNNFAWTHAACVILYFFFPLMRQRLKIHVANQIQKALMPNENGAVSSWSVIAHSLGTIVTHDVLQAMDSTTPNEAGISILDTMVPSAQVIAMIANVSRELQTDSDVYQSLVCPQSMVRNQACCFSYLNCNNKFDPFVQLERFDPPPDNVQWKLARANANYLDIRIQNIQELNVHSLRNYLVNPDVHIPLLEYLVGEGSITDDEKAKARQNFKQISDDLIAQAQQKVMDQVNQRLAGKTDLMAWFDLVGNYYSLVRSLHA